MPKVVGVLLVEADESHWHESVPSGGVGDGMAAMCHRIATVGCKSDGSRPTAHCGRR
jgi:hypothetical protein